MWSSLDKEFGEIFERLENNFKKLYVSRVHPDLVANVLVVAYGSEMKLNELANITIPSARTIEIKPYDISLIQEINKAIQKHKPEFSPIVQSDLIRISLLPPTEETRKRSVKEAKEYLEKAKVALRVVRKDFQVLIKKEELSEDLEKKNMNELDSKIKVMNGRLEEIYSKKEKELMTI
ncbi:ribosome recycling factor [Candidatus Mycoplasma haematobovis]|uniref:Ribosome recycling factor n=1 Tax=Candidatus Mycoplasma haematobovis TaxID=432608 RepID=A0A1A9QDW8_9MOLU|nr:ribosome recycling factor [Candidatus Mycoplasma haematobovis]